MSNLTFCSSVDTRNHVCSELLMNDADLKSGSWTEQKESKRNENIMTERGLPGVDIRQSISFQKGNFYHMTYPTHMITYDGPYQMGKLIIGRKISIALRKSNRPLPMAHRLWDLKNL